MPPAEAPSIGVRLRDNFVQFAARERYFLILIAIGFFVVGATYQTPSVAMWIGFAIAGYSAVANDSIQTLGTFIASNQKTPWWLMWLFVGGIFLITVGYSWYTYDGDVSYQRLMSPGFETAPTHFEFLHIAAPIFLLILTRLRMPVSTTFLLLTCFATKGKGIMDVTLKSVGGYGIAFVCALVVWLAFGPAMKRWFRGKAHPLWVVAQWGSAGFLWSVWLMQDAANIAVYLPRSLSFNQFAVFGIVIFIGLGVLLRMGGEKVQEVVDEKADVVEVRAATMINLIYGVILYVFKEVSKVPMSTTWVFVGLLAGREIAMAVRRSGAEERSVRFALRLVVRDLVYVTIGFIVALALAAVINPVVGKALFE
ncbi:MAG: hypothetical protein KC620_13535 [Myxococcales bacterium]|nr:hypothetical protein [Myxococcales bacterium]